MEFFSTTKVHVIEPSQVLENQIASYNYKTRFIFAAFDRNIKTKMNNLWKKETNGSSFVNIFANVNKNPFEKMLAQLSIGVAVNQNQKNNKTSTKLRQSGNEKFAEKNWRLAMKYYNLSLRYAEIGTDNVALAYANRSNCFLKLGMFDKCIIDVELARKANYPKDKMSKLEERRAYCLQQMKKEPPTTRSVSKLDFAANGAFPGMANVMEMRYNEKFGRHFIATRDIDVGKVIVVEEAFITTTVMETGQNICDACFKHMTNFIACPNCTFGLFCNEICAEDYLHKMRCGRSSKDDNSLVEFALRSVLCALDVFNDYASIDAVVDDMINFVESTLQDPKKFAHVPQSLVDKRSKYRLFLTLNLWMGSLNENELIARAHDVFEIVLKQPLFKDVFSSKKNHRFLMHLCVFHTYTVFCNSFQSKATGGIFLLRNHINHSCSPNLLCGNYENKSICITSRPVKKGDQLFISYGERYFTQSRAERQRDLRKDFGFQCDCEKCKNKSYPISSGVIRSDAEYQCLAKELDMKKINFSDGPKCAMLKQKCLEILIKYSDQPWTTEKDLVANFYQQLSVETIY